MKRTSGNRVRQLLADWPAHILMVVLVMAVLAIAPRQMTLLVYKAALPMIGACGGYWLCCWFLGHFPERGDLHDRWQLVALMCAGMLTMGLAA